MIARIRLLVLIARPSVVVIFCLFCAVGVAQGGAPHDAARLAACLLPVIGFIVFSVVVNDLADRSIDEVNLPGDRRRPLVAGTTTEHEYLALAVMGAAVAIAGSVRLGMAASVVMLGGLGLSACYSLRPVRIADRGVVAPVLLPAGYVAVPYLLGVFSVRSGLTSSDLALGAGLYLGFVGRILLKDFRDVRGDALFGKRTFLVRHGRCWTCGFSAACWVGGAVAVMAVRQPTPALVAAYALEVAVVLVLLVRLATESNARREEHMISAIAVVGRGLVLTLLIHLSAAGAGWSSSMTTLVIGVTSIVIIGQAMVMAYYGPHQRCGGSFDKSVRDLVADERFGTSTRTVEAGVR